ncbi:MAG TPA: aspartyl protease family protein [Myxococcota bacterium]|nr:aspartyl protease family protein [Myxococcota bacterium]
MSPRVWVIAAACLALTARADPAPEVPAAAVVGDLPFLEHPELNRVFIDLAPQGARPFRLLLDTGAEASVLTPLYARELGVTVRRARDTENRRETVLGRDLEFWIDTRSSESGSRTGWEYGLLGGNFLSQYVVELDFAKRRVRFLDPDTYQVPASVDDPNEAVIRLHVAGNRPFADVGIDGKPVNVLFDTGAPGTLLLSGSSARKAGFEKPHLATLAMGGVLGKIESYLVEADELTVGPFRFAPAPIVFAPHGAYNQGGNTDSALGYEVLSHFVVRVDYARNRMWLRREDAQPLAWFGTSWAAARRAGLLARVGDGGIDVQGVLPDSPAAKLGVQAGDEVEFHDDQPRDKALENVIAGIERGDSLVVLRGDGDQKTQVKLEGTKPASPP